MAWSKPKSGTRVNQNHPLARGMAACWIFNDGSISFSGSQAIFARDSRNNCHGTLGGGAIFSYGLFGSVLKTEATNGSVSIPQNQALNVGGRFSVAAWVMATSYAGIRGAIFSTRTAVNPAGGWQLEAGTGNGGTARVTMTGLATFIFDSNDNAVVANKWHHIVYTRKDNSDTGTMYVDGKPIAALATAAYTASDNTNAKLIAQGTSAAQTWPGKISAVQLWNRPLSAQEVRQLYAQPFCFMRELPYDQGKPFANAVLDASGTFDFVGSADLTISKSLDASGTFDFGGSALPGITKPLNASGSFDFDGSADLTITKNLSASGSMDFGGLANLQLSGYFAVGTFTFGGSAILTVVPINPNRPLLEFRPDWNQGIEHGQLDDFTFDAATGGAAIPWKVTSLPKRTLKLSFLLSTYAEIKSFRDFIGHRDGRRRGFWLPTWLTDYVPAFDASAGAGAITVKNIALGSKLTFSSQFRWLAIITSSKIEMYRVMNSTVSGATELLTLSRGLDTPLVAKHSVVCGVLYARFADDVFEFQYQAGNVARIDCSFVELPKETEALDIDGTRPAFLYLFQQGSVNWRMTNFPVKISIGGFDWLPSIIEHDEITENIDFSPDPISLSLASDDPAHPLRLLLNPLNVDIINLTIYKTSAEAPLEADLSTPIYKGRVGQVQFNERGQITQKASSLLRIGEQQVPQTLMERVCAHRTYDGGCKVNPAGFTTTATITAIASSPPYIEAPAFGTVASAHSDPNWFALGLVTIGDQKRFCTGQNGNRLYLNFPFWNVTVGASATALAGDDKRAATCLAKFNNIVNFLGFPYMPNKSPQFEALETPKPGGGKK